MTALVILDEENRPLLGLDQGPVAYLLDPATNRDGLLLDLGQALATVLARSGFRPARIVAAQTIPPLSVALHLRAETDDPALAVVVRLGLTQYEWWSPADFLARLAAPEAACRDTPQGNLEQVLLDEVAGLLAQVTGCAFRWVAPGHAAGTTVWVPCLSQHDPAAGRRFQGRVVDVAPWFDPYCARHIRCPQCDVDLSPHLEGRMVITEHGTFCLGCGDAAALPLLARCEGCSRVARIVGAASSFCTHCGGGLAAPGSPLQMLGEPLLA